MSAAELHALKASYGVTFQEGALFSSLDVQQNVQLPMLEHLQLTRTALDELALLQGAAGGAAARSGAASIRRSSPVA